MTADAGEQLLCSLSEALERVRTGVRRVYCHVARSESQENCNDHSEPANCTGDDRVYSREFEESWTVQSVRNPMRKALSGPAPFESKPLETSPSPRVCGLSAVEGNCHELFRDSRHSRVRLWRFNELRSGRRPVSSTEWTTTGADRSGRCRIAGIRERLTCHGSRMSAGRVAMRRRLRFMDGLWIKRRGIARGCV